MPASESITLSLPAAVLRVVAALEREGYPAYVVGGCLRDLLRGVPPHDFDVTTAALPEQMQAVFARAGLRTVATGIRHGTLTVLSDGEPVECTTYRIESGYSDGRHPDRVVFSDRIADDLCRRDFTVNAMACRLSDPTALAMCSRVAGTALLTVRGELLDLFGGRQDLAAGVLRCVGDAVTRFEEDALRMLRCVRFCVQLGMVAEAQTRAALVLCRARLACVSRERCAAEWLRMLSCPMPLRDGLTLLSEAALWQYVMPGMAVDPSSALLDRTCLLPPEPSLRMACLVAGGLREQGMEAEASAVEVCRALRLSRALTDAVDRTVAVALTLREPPATEGEVRRLAARAGRETEAALLLCGVLALPATAVSAALHAGMSACEAVSDEWRAALTDCQTIRARGDALTIGELALRGGELAALGLQGREIGEMAAYLLEAVLDDPSRNEPQTLRRLCRERHCGAGSTEEGRVGTGLARKK